MPARKPLDKLPLAIRKNVRDNYENHVPENQSKIAKAIGIDSFTFKVDINALIPYADDSGPQQDPGYYTNEYFTSLVTAVEEYTKNGSDEEAKDVLKKVLHKKEATIAPREKLPDSIAGCETKDGVFYLLFRTDGDRSYFAGCANEACYKFAAAIDKGLDALGGEELPVVTRRSVAANLDPVIKEVGEKFESLFGKPIPLSYDVKAVLDAYHNRKGDGNTFNDFNDYAPNLIASYFTEAAAKLEYLNFGADDMLKEAFLESAENGIKFEVVQKLQHNQLNDCIFEDGFFKLQTTAQYIGSCPDEAAGYAVDRL